MAAKMVKRLRNLVIDEVSTVDRPANQHGVVSFSKRAEGGSMAIYDNEGYEVFEDELQPGDIVYDDQGSEFQVVPEDEMYDDDDLVDVGKALTTEPEVALGRRAQAARRARQAAEDVGRSARRTSGNAVTAGRRAYFTGQRGAQRAVDSTTGAYAAHPRAFIGGGAAAAGGGAAYGVHRSRASKSLGNEVYEELSKALTQGDRDEAIAKALDVVEVYKAEADYATSMAEQLNDERDLERYIEVAKSYGPLPIQSERLGMILKNAVDGGMPDEDLDELDRVLSAAGESLLYELGSAGSPGYTETMDQVEALAGQVAKSAGDVSVEQAMTALFEANPDAYSTYLAEKINY
jgi:hypothetical protein